MGSGKVGSRQCTKTLETINRALIRMEKEEVARYYKEARIALKKSM